MKKKSEENVLSAVLLIDNSLFTSSVHCSYYAGFQFTKYVLANFCGIDYERQEKESKGKDSHFYIQSEMEKRFEDSERLNFIDYNKYFNKLKKFRKKADYSQDFINKEEAEKACSCAEKLIDLLKTKCSIQ